MITLGSPTRFRERPQSFIDHLWQRLSPGFDPVAFAEISTPDHDQPRLTVPITAIFSRCDRVVPVDAAMLPTAPQTENVEVLSTHGLLGSHPAALYVIADRLTQPEDDWKPFRRPLPLAAWYPPAAAAPS